MHSFILKKIEQFTPSGKIYIMPTLDGIKLVATNLVLLVIGLTYANNFILLFNFILFGLFLCSMFYTNFNLEGLHLEGVKFNSTHVNEQGTLQLFFTSTSKLDHHFIKIKIKSNLIELENDIFSFSNSYNNHIQIDCRYKALARGKENITKIYLETLFPFHLFRSFSLHACNFETLIYPKLLNNKNFVEIKTESDQTEDTDEYALKSYAPGDPLTRVDWKKVAQKNQWFSRVLVAPKATPVTLSFHALEQNNIEEQLSSMATYLYQYETNGIPYGLLLEHFNRKIDTILPGNSIFHLKHCLRQLALYEH